MGCEAVVPAASMAVLRIGLGVAFLLKFAVESSRGYGRLLTPGSYNNYLITRNQRSHAARYAPFLYSVQYYLRPVGAVLLIVGARTGVGIAILLAASLIELWVNFRFHVCF